MKQVVLIGGFIEVIELCEECGYSILGIVDNEKDDNWQYDYLGNDGEFISNKDKYQNIPLVVTPDNPIVREKLYEKYQAEGFSFETVISNNSVVSKSAVIEEGCMICDCAHVSANVKLGRMTRVNCCANIMHDVSVGDFSVVAPNAVLLGRTRLANKTYVGANATVLPNVEICASESIIGAGAVITKDITEKGTYVGVPAKIVKKV